jgi:multiple sugar transport system substrate-binding protein
VLLAGVLAVSACSKSGGGNAGGQTTIEYWLWDSNQTAQYQACADDFMQANPDIKINITQTGWSDYWSNLSTNLTAGTGPDVFTDHLTYFPTFLDKQQIIDLQPYIDKDSVDMTQYFPGLADLWKDQKGDSYGLPKDWDTVAIFYNEKMITDAGYTDADLANLTWNPTDGGTYEKMIAHLTVDTNGVRGDEPGFDKNNIATYGLALEGVGAGFSQQQLAEYLFSTGWQFTDKNPWGTVYNFSDQRFKDTVSWSYSMVQAGYQNDLATALSMDGNAASGFAAGKYAMVTEGDWMISSFQAPDGSSVKFAPTPIGPTGKSTSMFNGLTDAITTSSKHPDQAWQWVKFLGSTQCQQHVADAGVVFPAIKSLSDATLKARTDQGIDVSAFMSYVDNGTTFPPPITEHFPDVVAIEQPVMENIMQGKADVSALDAANDQINALFTSGG